MKPTRFHSWNVSPEEASAIQLNLRDKVEVQPLPNDIELVCGTSISHDPNTNTVHVALVVSKFPAMELVECHSLSEETTFPYVSGLLAFREAPSLMTLLKRIQYQPDVILFHSHGLAHPRKFGLACHLGVLFNIPSIGVADRVLVGYHDNLPIEKGCYVPLKDNKQELGLVLRTKEDEIPIFVSVGHKSDLFTAMELTMKCITRYRHPEPIRQAQLAVRAQRDGENIDLEHGSNQASIF